MKWIRLYWWLLRHQEWNDRFRAASEDERKLISLYWRAYGELPQSWRTEHRP